ncbi:DNA polymerase III subunit gamma/tau [Fodinibius sp. Rm-B-1B1-1]|uniref:DNA polymerase III subunit gamma/tau n=1 Tax=Fodinibius alkaliphilus TaxID=3140241 RepID=UPI003159CCE6
MSDNYRALTRTYRPTSFDDIVSQKHVSSTLKNAIKKSRLAHAYMFCGPRGVGKTTMARVLARTVNEIDRDVDGESLNQTLNVVEIDAASNNSVDDIRDLRERVRIPPQNGRYKIYIIDEVHMLSKSAFNALLKTLEEPPDHVIFIFATTEPHKVLPTILSRVQRFDFKRISVDQIVERLANVAENEGIRIDEESLHVIAKKADGALRDALGLMDQAIAFCGNNIEHEELLRALNVVSTERMFDFMNAVEAQDSSRGLELINDLLQEGYDIQEYLVGLTEHLRNLYVAKSSEQMHLVEASPDTKKRYRESSKAFSEDDLMRMLHIVSEAQYKIKEAHQPKIQFEITLLKLIHMERSQKLNTLLTELEGLKKKLNNSELPASDTQESAKQELDSEIKSPPASEQKTEEPVPNTKPPNQKGKAEASQSPEQPTHPQKQTEPDTSTTPAKNTNGQQTPQEKPKSKQKVADTAASESEKEDSQKDDEFDNLFGTSSLEKPEPDAPQPNSAPEPQESQQTETTTVQKRAPKDVTLQEINDCWEDYLGSLRHHVPHLLYLQMQRVDAVELKNGDLKLRATDEFAKKIVDENKRRLGKFLEDEIGAFLSFSCFVKKQEKNSEDSMSPYERFKKLQERDPTIKKLVELFGAELDYNLNQ